MIDVNNRLALAMENLSREKIIVEARILADHLGVNEVLDYVMQNNPSKDLPYHNNIHQLLMAVTAVRLYTVTPRVSLGLDNFDFEEATALFVAGLFHDYNHTGGKDEDYINIHYALEAFCVFMTQFRSPTRININEQMVMALIRSTEWPWKKEEFHYLQGILRDADILVQLELVGTFMPIDGLPRELEHRLGKLVTPVEMANGQEQFMTSVELNTDAGKRMWEHLFPLVLNVQKFYAQALERTKEQ